MRQSASLGVVGAAVVGVGVLLTGCSASPPEVPAASTPARTCDAAQKKPYLDGTFTGVVDESRHGTVAVTVIIADGCIASLSEELNPADGQSKQIQKQAIPLLREAVYQANAAEVDVISGATYTSKSYRASLQAALDQAQG